MHIPGVCVRGWRVGGGGWFLGAREGCGGRGGQRLAPRPSHTSRLTLNLLLKMPVPKPSSVRVEQKWLNNTIFLLKCLVMKSMVPPP